VPRRTLLSLPKAPAPASPAAPHRSLPNAGVTYREHPTDVGPLLEAADQLQARDESEIPGSGKVYIILLDYYLLMSRIPKHRA
jgi:hypothetical protein